MSVNRATPEVQATPAPIARVASTKGSLDLSLTDARTKKLPAEPFALRLPGGFRDQMLDAARREGLSGNAWASRVLVEAIRAAQAGFLTQSTVVMTQRMHRPDHSEHVKSFRIERTHGTEDPWPSSLPGPPEQPEPPTIISPAPYSQPRIKIDWDGKPPTESRIIVTQDQIATWTPPDSDIPELT